MRKHWIVRGIKFALFAVLFIGVSSFLIMTLWNWLVPALFAGARLITFWQALGILILSKILFGGFRGWHGHHGHWRRRMMERWEQMTPEEREKFRKGMEMHCGNFSMGEPKSANLKDQQSEHS